MSESFSWRNYSPGWSQHLLDVIVRTTAPFSHECLAALTKFMNFLLSGRTPSCLAPWLCGLCEKSIIMKNAFNQCNRASFLAEVSGGISVWTRWCYAQPAKLHFGDQRILASAAVQQGDPLGPLLFFLVLLGFIRSAGLHSSICLPLWYLDDGTFIGPQSSLTAFLTSFSQDGPVFGLHLNLVKCEIFWSSGDFTFPEFLVAVCRVGIISGGVELLGCPLWGSLDSFLIVLTKVFSVCLRLILSWWFGGSSSRTASFV